MKFADDFDLIIPVFNLDSRNAELQHIEDWAIVNNRLQQTVQPPEAAGSGTAGNPSSHQYQGP